MGYGGTRAPDFYCGLWLALMKGLCLGVVELARYEKERQRQAALRRKLSKPLRRSLNPAPTAAKVSAQWSRTRSSLLETLRFGSLLMDLEPAVDSSPVVQYNKACTHKVIVARNPGLKGWLHERCREVGYRTALRYKNLAERVHKACGLPLDTPLEWAFPDQASQDAAHSRKTKGDLKAARETLLALLTECPNAARLLARLDVLQSVTHRKLAKPRKAFSAIARKRREEKVVETLLRSVRDRTQRRLSALDRETRDRLLRGLLTLAEEIRSSADASAIA